MGRSDLRTVVVVGPRQCGSTRAFNAARLVGEVAGLVVRAHWGVQPHPDAPTYSIDVAKVHHESTGPQLRASFDVVILPLRDLRDAALSSIARKFIKRDDLVRFCLHQIRIIERLAPYATLVLRYETFNAHTIRRIARAMCVRLTRAQVNTVMHRLDELYRSNDLPAVDDRANTLYQRTLMSRAHNTANGRSNKWRTQLSSTELRALRNRASIVRFYKRYGYAL